MTSDSSDPVLPVTPIRIDLPFAQASLINGGHKGWRLHGSKSIVHALACSFCTSPQPITAGLQPCRAFYSGCSLSRRYCLSKSTTTVTCENWCGLSSLTSLSHFLVGTYLRRTYTSVYLAHRQVRPLRPSRRTKLCRSATLVEPRRWLVTGPAWRDVPEKGRFVEARLAVLSKSRTGWGGFHPIPKLAGLMSLVVVIMGVNSCLTAKWQFRVGSKVCNYDGQLPGFAVSLTGEPTAMVARYTSKEPASQS